MTNVNFIELAISEVRKYVLNHLDKSDKKFENKKIICESEE
jgi:hypothetical protein